MLHAVEGAKLGTAVVKSGRETENGIVGVFCSLAHVAAHRQDRQGAIAIIQCVV